MEYGKIHRLETLIILQITQAQLPASFQEGEPMKDKKNWHRRQTAAVEPTDRYPSTQENLKSYVSLEDHHVWLWAVCRGVLYQGGEVGDIKKEN